jgi:hypothetical protein
MVENPYPKTNEYDDRLAGKRQPAKEKNRMNESSGSVSLSIAAV